MPFTTTRRRALQRLAAAGFALGPPVAMRPARAASEPAAPAGAPALPPDVLQALARAQVPPEALSAVVQPVAGEDAPPARRLDALAAVPRNPASLMKLATTQAALDLLGPAWAWRTPVWLQGTLKDGVLDGSVAIRGSGDPKLTLERVWLMLRRVQQQGVREIRGDIVLDRSAFAVPPGNAADFDGEPLRPYNVRPDALLLAHKAVIYTFTPDAQRNIATVAQDPPLDGMRADTEVPLAAGGCDDWRAALKASIDDPVRLRFGGRYPASCGERLWPLAYPDPASYDARVLRAMWRDLGGRLLGTVRDGNAPLHLAPSFELVSPPLAEVVRDINKFSNNVMAQQLWLTLAARQGAVATPELARETLARWLAERLDAPPGEAVVDNGSGLSRDNRLSARVLARLLQQAWASPTMPELMASLPVSGLDGTLRRSRAPVGRAHLKTGSLRDVAGIAGYVLAASGRRYVVVGLVQHPNAGAARPALDALVQWVINDTAPAPPAAGIAVPLPVR